MLIQQENMRFKMFWMTNFIFLEIFFKCILKVVILCLQVSQLCVMTLVRMRISVDMVFWGGRKDAIFEQRCVDTMA